MLVARAILALLITVSLAALPAAAHAAMGAKVVDMSAMDHMGTADMSAMDHMGTADMSAMDDMDCCPHKSDTSKKAGDDCAAMVGCVMCTGFLNAESSSSNFPLLLSSRAFSSPSDPLLSQTGSPPFRPPRI